LRYPWIGCALALSLAVVACSGGKSGDDDDNGGASGDGGTGGSGGKAGTGGGTGAKGGTGGSGGTGGGSAGTGGSAGSGITPIGTGPRAFPQNKALPHCTLTTVADASGKVQTAYNFWKSTFVVSATGGLRVQRTENQNDTVSEGMGYGMLIAVYMNDQATFEGLWGFTKAHLDSVGLMTWHLNADGSVATGGQGSATDADEDIAFALIMASVQWPSSTYLADGAKMAKAILMNEVAGDGMLKPGDNWGDSDKTYPDYFSPAYIRVFKKVAPHTFWDTVLTRNYEILAKVSGTYGLVPDSTTATYALTESYKYDACRTPWRIGMDYCFNGTPEAKTYLTLVGGFFDSQGAVNIGDGYSLTGQKTSSFGNMAFVGPAGVAGMAGFPKLLDDAFTYGSSGTGGTTNYYQQTLRVITMLMMSGNLLDYSQL